MKIENPPGSGNVEEVEKFEDDREIDRATRQKEQLTNDLIEKAFDGKSELADSDLDRIEEIKSEIEAKTSVKREIEDRVQHLPTGGEEGSWNVPNTKNTAPKVTNRARNAYMAVRLGLAGLLGLGATGATEAKAGNLNDSTKNNIENIKKGSEDSLNTDKGTIKAYPGGKTKEGATTPTGFNNSFFNNEYKIEEGDVTKVAEKFGFRTTSVKDFQDDMFGYLEKNFPEDMKKLVKKYGVPAAGTMRDEILGIRVAFAMSILKDKKTVVLEQKEVNPYAAFAESGEIIYAPGAGGHGIAEVCYPVRDSKSIKDGGSLDASKQGALIRFRNDFGFTGEVVHVTAEELTKLLGTTNHFQDQEQINKLKEKATKK